MSRRARRRLEELLPRGRAFEQHAVPLVDAGAAEDRADQPAALALFGEYGLRPLRGQALAHRTRGNGGAEF
jgi:hypothetical protein